MPQVAPLLQPDDTAEIVGPGRLLLKPQGSYWGSEGVWGKNLKGGRHSITGDKPSRSLVLLVLPRRCELGKDAGRCVWEGTVPHRNRVSVHWNLVFEREKVP